MRELLKRVLNARTIGYPLPPSIVKEIEAELAKPEPEPELLVNVWRDGNLPCFNNEWLSFPTNWEVGSYKLYTHPPAQQKPLSDDEIMNFYNESAANPKNAWKIKSVIIETARRVEQAHGIK